MAIKTQGEIEAAICEGMARFQQEYMGRGPKAIHAHLIDDLLLVRSLGKRGLAPQPLIRLGAVFADQLSRRVTVQTLRCRGNG